MNNKDESVAATNNLEEEEESKAGLPRAQSSLELLSQTAAVVDLEEQQQIIISQTTSPIARVTPAEPIAFLDSKASNFLSFPDTNSCTMEHQQKSSFLPRSVTSVQSLDVVGGGSGQQDEHFPGLFLSYSNVSGGTGVGGSLPAGAGNPSAIATSNSSEGEPFDAASAAAAAVGGFFSANSFSSGGSHGSTVHHAAAAPPPPPPGNGNAVMHFPNPSAAAFIPPRSGGCNGLEDPIRENAMLRQQLVAKDSMISALTQQVQSLQQEIRQLRQLPTGKISQIPIEDMLAIMREYGSEVSDTAMPPRKTFIQKASVVRQFRRWNPNFLEYFEYQNGQWLPKLGREDELQRRHQARREAAIERRKKQLKKQHEEEEEGKKKKAGARL